MTADQLGPNSLRLLVPLCGKTVDMMWCVRLRTDMQCCSFQEFVVITHSNGCAQSI